MLVGHWPLTEGSGDALDYSGDGNDGTVSGATQGASGPMGYDCYSFDGVDDDVQIPNFSGMDIVDQLTVSIWAKTTDTSDTQRLVSTQDGTHNWWVRLDDSDADSTTELEVYMTTGSGGNVRSAYAETALGDGGWHHIVAVFDTASDEVTLYEDGSASPLTDIQTGTVGTVSPTAPLYLGREPSSGGGNGGVQAWDGSLFHAQMWNCALTPEEVQYLYGVSERASYVSGVKTL